MNIEEQKSMKWKIIEKISEAKSCFFGEKKKIDKPNISKTKNKRHKSLMSGMKWDNTTDPESH